MPEVSFFFTTEEDLREARPLDSITLIVASSNSAHLKRTLEGMGYRAEVVRSDVVSGWERKRKVCDVRDADNIALAYIHGDAGEFVWMPTDECAEGVGK